LPVDLAELIQTKKPVCRQESSFTRTGWATPDESIESVSKLLPDWLDLEVEASALCRVTHINVSMISKQLSVTPYKHETYSILYYIF